MSGAPLILAALTATVGVSAERVVLISVDGLRADALEKLGRERAPSFFRLIAEGAGTLNARSDRTKTNTMPNHVCMVTGRPVAGAEGHGYTENTYAGLSIHRVKRNYVPSVFDVVHDHGHRAALVSAKDKFTLFSVSYGAEGAPDRLPPDDGRRKIDQTSITRDDRQSIETALGLLRITRTPRFIFLHLAGTDAVGHGEGFDISDGSAYLAEVQRQDELLGRILFAIGARGSLSKTTAIILTSDHGGDGPSHSDSDRLENFRIPFLVWGAGVSPGAELYSLNQPSRADPKREKEGERPPIRNCDAGNLALQLLGLPSLEGSTFDGIKTAAGSGR